MYLWSILSSHGYCSDKPPKEFKTTGTLNSGETRLYTYYRLKTYQFENFNFIHSLFYFNGVKIIPTNLMEYLTPIAIAFWIMDDGGRYNEGTTLLSTHSFARADLELAVHVFKVKYNINTNIINAGVTKQNIPRFKLVFQRNSMDTLRKLVASHIHPSMLYKVWL